MLFIPVIESMYLNCIKIEFYIVPSVSCFIVFIALEALFGPDFDLVTSARFLPKSVLGMFNNIYRKSNDQDSSY